jgi:hypothetical protein
MEIRSIIEIQRAKKEWKEKYRGLLHNKDHYKHALKLLKTEPLTNEVMGMREALNELIQE